MENYNGKICRALERNERQASGRQGGPDYEKSSRPLEYGVVYSEYGTVAAGQVLTGLAFGSNPVTIRLIDLFRDNTDISNFISRNPALSQATITNYYAGTVAGLQKNFAPWLVFQIYQCKTDSP